jgi:hypothetical protein
MTHLKPNRLGIVKALFFFIAFALIFTLSLSLLHSSKADELTTQALITRDLGITGAEVTIVGANENDNLGGSGSPDTFTDLTRSHPLAVGDFNDDGIQDIAMGAPNADYTPPGVGTTNRPNAGAVYILFGRNTFTNPTLIDTNIAAGNQPDVKVYGALTGDNVGFSLAVGDVNGDSADDLLIGAPGVSFGNPLRTDTGAVYVLFGASTLVPKTIDLLQANVINLAIYGEKAGDKLGTSVASADVGGATTIADMVLGAVGSKGPANDRTDAGAAFVLFGGTALTPPPNTTGVIDLTISSAAVKIFGTDGSLFGSSLAIGNVNAAGPGDIIVGAPKANRPAPSVAADTGAVYIINGGTNLAPAAGQQIKTFDIALTEQSVTIYGNNTGDHLGVSVAAGDITGDSIDDLAMGAPDADGPVDGRPNAGEAYVLSGNANLTVRINASNTQLTIFGEESGNRTGSTVAIGRINSGGNVDGISELLVGSPAAQLLKGNVHVFYGGASLTILASRDIALGQDDLRVIGQVAGDELGWALAAADLDSNRGGDLIVSAPFFTFGAGTANPRPKDGRVYAILAADVNVPPVNQAPLVQVLTPNGAELLNGGSSFAITWTATDTNGDDTIQSYEIRLSIDGGANYNTIVASNIPGNTKTFNWTVNGGLNTNTARIRVIATDAGGLTGQDSSNANFTITDPGVTVDLLTPNGGEMLQFGQVFRITWEVPAASAPQVKGFDLFLSTDGGVTFNNNPIKADPLNPAIAKDVRLFDWTVPSNICSSQARILIVATSITGARSSDSSAANFSTVGPGPTVNTTAIELDETLSRLVLRTIQPPIGNEILFTQTSTIEISTTEAGTTFSTFSKPFKFKKEGRVVITKGTINNGQDLNVFFPNGATRILRITNQPCGVTVLRIMRTGNVFVVVPPPAG